MSSLSSALAELRGQDLGSLGDGELKERFTEIQRASQVLESERLRALAEINRRGSCAEEGYLSTATWVADRFHVPVGEAFRDVRTATDLGTDAGGPGSPGIGGGLLDGRSGPGSGA